MTDGNEAENEGIGRRSVLQTIGAAGAAAAASGIGAASPGADFDQTEIDFVKRSFQDASDIEAVLESERGLLESLSEKGFLEEATIDALGIESLGWADSTEDSVVQVTPARSEDGLTPDIRISPEVDEGALRISIKPETGESFAVYNGPSTDSWEQVAGSVTVNWCYCSRVNYTACCDCYPVDEIDCSVCDVICY